MKDRWHEPSVLQATIEECCCNLVERGRLTDELSFIHPSITQYLLEKVPENLSAYSLHEESDKRLCGELCLKYLALADFRLALSLQAQKSVIMDAGSLQGRVLGTLNLPPLLNRIAGYYLPQASSPSLRPLSGHMRSHGTRNQPKASIRQEFAFLAYAKKAWPYHTSLLDPVSPYWNHFCQLALVQENIYGLQPWATESSNRDSYLTALFEFGLRHRHIPLLTVVLDEAKIKKTRLELTNTSLHRTNQLPLHIAVALDFSDVVDLLIRYGARTNIPDPRGNTALHIAAQFNSAACIDLLMERETSPWKTNDDLDSPVDTAARRGHQEFLNSMLPLLQPFDPFLLNSAIIHAVVLGYDGCVSSLLINGADVDFCGSDGCTLLHYATERGHIEVVRTLLRHNCKVNVLDSDGRDPLLLAIALPDEKSLPITKYLTRRLRKTTRGSLMDSGYTGSKNTCALSLALVVYLAHNSRWFGQHSIQNFPLKDQEVENALAKNAICCLDLIFMVLSSLVYTGGEIFRGLDSSEMIRLIFSTMPSDLIIKLAERNAISELFLNNEGRTLIHIAAAFENILVLKHLVRGHTIGLAQPDWKGLTPLHIAAQLGNREATAMMLDQATSSPLSSKDYDGNTPLHLAAQKGYSEIVKLLIENGSSISIKNSIGQTALHLASIRQSQECCDMLIAAGSPKDQEDIHGLTALDHDLILRKFNAILKCDSQLKSLALSEELWFKSVRCEIKVGQDFIFHHPGKVTEWIDTNLDPRRATDIKSKGVELEHDLDPHGAEKDQPVIKPRYILVDLDFSQLFPVVPRPFGIPEIQDLSNQNSLLPQDFGVGRTSSLSSFTRFPYDIFSVTTDVSGKLHLKELWAHEAPLAEVQRVEAYAHDTLFDPGAASSALAPLYTSRSGASEPRLPSARLHVVDEAEEHNQNPP